MAFYLKYRPQTFDDIIGQEAVKKTVQLAFRANNLSHAYLLVGPRGTGKTSTARIIAKMVNCEAENTSGSGQIDIPCNKCLSCISITDGSNLDLIEIDAASNRGIDDIRSLREKIRLAPTSNKKKVYIIDEVHMLTTEAFNALLKTLEEPPAHALFILATTEAQKVPATILSRVQRLDFKLASTEEIKKALKKVADGEGIEIEDSALDLLVRRADGSFRDGVKLLDQASSLDKKITQEIVENGLQATKWESVYELVKIVLEGNTAGAILYLSKLVSDGLNVKDFTLSLLESLRHLFLIKNGLGSGLVEPEVGSEKYALLSKLADNVLSEKIIRSLEVISQTLEKLKVSPIPTLPLELAIAKIGQKEEVSRQKEDIKTLPEEIVPPVKQVANLSVPPEDSSDMAKLNEKWNFVLETIKPYNFSLEALLRAVKIVQCGDGVIVLEVPYSFHQRILESPKSRDLLESVLADVLSKQVRVTTILGERPQRVEDIANVEVAADDEVLRIASEIFQGKVVE